MLANEEADASHPSEYNPAVDDPSSKAAERAVMTREIKPEMRYNNAEKTSLYPTHDLWVGPQAERSQRDTKREGHEEAFTDRHVGSGTYQPYWGISMIPAFGWV